MDDEAVDELQVPLRGNNNFYSRAETLSVNAGEIETVWETSSWHIEYEEFRGGRTVSVPANEVGQRWWGVRLKDGEEYRIDIRALLQQVLSDEIEIEEEATSLEEVVGNLR